MGYTHYWELNKKTKITNLKGCLKNIRIVLEQYKDIIQFESDEDKKPIITNHLIKFNGINGDGHETFYFEFPAKRKETEWNKYNSETNSFVFYFCKTARKPYNIVVCKCLLILKEYLKDDMKLSSDGEFNNEWKQAIDEVQNMGIDILPYIVIEAL
jgi:hypothetical protein|tara:strand:- start:2600 stop:3067 length:468 start_codon:yes stop_codon:yes gene_type:complete